MKKENGDCFRDSCEKLENLKAEAQAKIVASLGDGGCDFCKAFVEKYRKNHV
jgi:hypothetical protein